MRAHARHSLKQKKKKKIVFLWAIHVILLSYPVTIHFIPDLKMSVEANAQMLGLLFYKNSWSFLLENFINSKILFLKIKLQNLRW